MDAEERNGSISIAFFGMVAAIFYISGAVGLLYEVAWFRRLHLVFGVSSFAIGAVIAAYMLGLAAGSRWAGSSGWLCKNPLVAYGWLEVGIALYALAFPHLVDWLEGAYVVSFAFLEGHFLIQSVVRFVLALAVLLPPTFLMGASLPAIAQVVTLASEEMPKKVGWLYAINTFGGVTGTLLAGFYTLEHFGIRGSIHLGLAGNLLVAIAAFLLARHPAHRTRRPLKVVVPNPVPATADATADTGDPVPILFAVVTVTVTGLVSMAGEIIWTRALVFFIHNSTYAFSSVLAVYLLGIAGGAALGTRLLRRRDKAMRWLARVLVAVCLSTLCSIAVYRHLPAVAHFLLGGDHLDPDLITPSQQETFWVVRSWATALVAIFGQVAAVLLLPAFFVGMVFPLTLRLVQSSRQTTAGLVGKLYAWNTVGAVVGTILGTFVLVTVFGTGHALLLLAWLPAPIAVWAICKDAPRRESRRNVGLFAVTLIAGSLIAAPTGFYRQLFESRFGRVVWFSEGVSETVAICEQSDGIKWIQYSDGRGASGTMSFSGGWLYAHLPLLLHPNPDSALVICFGTGNTLGAASLHPLKKLKGVELSSEVVKASHVFRATNHHVADNPDVNIVIDDGRNFLLATRERFDVITEEPPLVHTAGVVNLYSKDFYELCSNRMTDNGVMAVWLATWELEELELRMLVKAFVEAFPHTSVWDCTHQYEWLLIGSKQPLRIDLDNLQKRMSEPRIARDLARIGIRSPADLLSLHLKGREFLLKFAGDVDPVTDDKTVVDYTAPRQARANFGLGEQVTAGLAVFGVGPQGFRTETWVRKFNSIYAFRDPVKPWIGSYGSFDSKQFLDEVHRKQTERELEAAEWISDAVIYLARDFRARGKLEDALDTVRRGLALVPSAASADILREQAAVHQEMGHDEKATRILQQLPGARDVSP